MPEEQTFTASSFFPLHVLVSIRRFVAGSPLSSIPHDSLLAITLLLNRSGHQPGNMRLCNTVLKALLIVGPVVSAAVTDPTDPNFWPLDIKVCGGYNKDCQTNGLTGIIERLSEAMHWFRIFQ